MSFTVYVLPLTVYSSEQSSADVWPEARSAGYDPDAYWDEDNGVWATVTVAVAGGGRYQSQLVAVGQNDAGQGVVYYTPI